MRLLTLAAICGVVSSPVVFACCNLQHHFTITDISSSDVLNARSAPHHQASIVAKLKPSQPQDMFILENAYIEKVECVTQELEAQKLQSTSNDPESIEVYNRLDKEKILAKAPTAKPLPRGSWCQMQFGSKKTGWVNARFIKYKCTKQISDTGQVSACINSKGKDASSRRR
jgi:hypothetical protein